MRIVVIGCNGFIGKAISNELDQLGIESIGISKEDFNLLEDATATKLSKVLKQDDQIVFTSSIAPSKSAEDVRNSIKMAETFCKSRIPSRKAENVKGYPVSKAKPIAKRANVIRLSDPE